MKQVELKSLQEYVHFKSLCRFHNQKFNYLGIIERGQGLYLVEADKQFLKKVGY